MLIIWGLLAPTLSGEHPLPIKLSQPSTKSTPLQNSLRNYVLPQLGRIRVGRITTADTMAVLLPHWATKHETMRRMKQRLSRIFRWAVAEGYQTDDPARATLDAALPRNGRSTRHFAALPHGEVAAAIETVRNSGAWPTRDRTCSIDGGS